MNRMSLLMLVMMTAHGLLISQQDFTGTLSGLVVDVRTLDPILGANVVVVQLPTRGAASDETGRFHIPDLPVGTYSVRVTALGYQTRVVTNIIVTTGRSTPVRISLTEGEITAEEVVVQASYFSRAQQLSPISTNIYDRSEIMRTPGSVQDVQRIVQNLPGVASSTDNINELIVRGGAPFENLTVLDGMEIPSINHYANQFNSAGPINMVNADMIEDVQFSAGGYPAQFGDKSSSIMNVTVRQGDRRTPFASNSGFNFAGIGTLIEGGMFDGRGSYIFSARNSLLEVFDKILGLGAISLTAVPRYWDVQTKLVYDLTPSSSIIFNGLYGDSRITFEGEPEEMDELRANTVDTSGVERLDPVTKQYAAGLTYRSLIGDKGFARIILYSQGTTGEVDVFNDVYHRVYDRSGNVVQRQLLSSSRVFRNSSFESFAALKAEAVYKVHPRHDLSVGGLAGTSVDWKNDVYTQNDTLRFDIDQNGTFETGPIVRPGWDFTMEQPFGQTWKAYLYASDKIALSQHLSLTLGLRYDWFSYADRSTISPRGSISWQVLPPTTVLTFSVGRYTQTHPFPFYGDARNTGINRNLDYMSAMHYVVGAEHILDDGLKLSVEAYYKMYDNIALDEDFIRSADETFFSEKRLTVGERRAYGFEFFLQKKQVEDWFGTFSLSLSRTRDADKRIPPLTDWYASEFDYPVIMTVVGGKTVKGVRDWLDDAPFFLKYPSYILPFSNEMEVGFKYRYQSGRPYTPSDFVTWRQRRMGGIRWTSGTWVMSDRVNAERYPDYSRLDIQWLSRYYFRSWNITVYLAIQNLLNTQNVFFEGLRSDGKKETVYQFQFFPVGGIEIEF